MLHKLYEERETIKRQANSADREMTDDKTNSFNFLNSEMKREYQVAETGGFSVANLINSSFEISTPFRNAESKLNLRGPGSNAQHSNGISTTGIPSTSQNVAPSTEIASSKVISSTSDKKVSEKPEISK